MSAMDISYAFHNAYKEKPDALKNFDGTDGQRGGANQATANTINLMGVQKMQLHMMNTIMITDYLCIISHLYVTLSIL